jgi:hypothetical protein
MDRVRLTSRNIVARSRYSYSGNAAFRPVCIAELHVTVSNINILSVAQKCVCGDCMSWATIKRT